MQKLSLLCSGHQKFGKRLITELQWRALLLIDHLQIGSVLHQKQRLILPILLTRQMQRGVAVDVAKIYLQRIFVLQQQFYDHQVALGCRTVQRCGSSYVGYIDVGLVVEQFQRNLLQCELMLPVIKYFNCCCMQFKFTPSKPFEQAYCRAEWPWSCLWLTLAPFDTRMLTICSLPAEAARINGVVSVSSTGSIGEFKLSKYSTSCTFPLKTAQCISNLPF